MHRFTTLCSSDDQAKRSAARMLVAVVLGFATFAPQPVEAMLLRACRPTDSALVCRLQSVLTLLDAAAGILGALLLFAVFAAVRAYRRKPRKLAPEDIIPDAR